MAPDLRFPCGSLYAVNARFNLPAPAPTDTYSVVRVPG